MENQHRKITGYRDLTQIEIDLMNEIKSAAVVVEGLVEKLATWHYTTEDGALTNDRPDQRWVSIGRTELQQGFMALTRSVAKPTTF